MGFEKCTLFSGAHPNACEGRTGGEKLIMWIEMAKSLLLNVWDVIECRHMAKLDCQCIIYSGRSWRSRGIFFVHFLFILFAFFLIISLSVYWEWFYLLIDFYECMFVSFVFSSIGPCNTDLCSIILWFFLKANGPRGYGNFRWLLIDCCFWHVKCFQNILIECVTGTWRDWNRNGPSSERAGIAGSISKFKRRNTLFSQVSPVIQKWFSTFSFCFSILKVAAWQT